MAFSVPLRLHAEILASQKGRDTDVNSVDSGREVDGEVVAGKLKAIVAWYPSVDFTRPRPEREAIPARPDLMMPKVFTDLFDASYLQPPTLDYSLRQVSSQMQLAAHRTHLCNTHPPLAVPGKD